MYVHMYVCMYVGVIIVTMFQKTYIRVSLLFSDMCNTDFFSWTITQQPTNLLPCILPKNNTSNTVSSLKFLTTISLLRDTASPLCGYGFLQHNKS